MDIPEQRKEKRRREPNTQYNTSERAAVSIARVLLKR
jgi:hypothetical protein